MLSKLGSTMMFRKILPPLVACLVLGAGWSLARQNPGIQVRVLPQAEVFNDSFTLGDIAEIEGASANDLVSLTGVVIGRSPLPGRSLRISAGQIRSRLRGSLHTEIQLTIPRQAQVLRAAQAISGEEVAQVITAHASAQAKAGEVLELVSPIQDLLLPMGPLRWDLKTMGRNLAQGGVRTYRVRALVNEQEAWRGVVRIKATVVNKVLIASRSIGKGQIVSSDDVREASEDLSNLRGEGYLSTLSQAVGQIATRNIGKDELLRSDLLQAPLDLSEGGRVTVLYETPGLVLRALGVVMVSGKIGQFVPVKNLETGKIVYGIVQDRETIKVN